MRKKFIQRTVVRDVAPALARYVYLFARLFVTLEYRDFRAFAERGGHESGGAASYYACFHSSFMFLFITFRNA